MNKTLLLGFVLLYLAFSEASKFDCHTGNGELRDALNAALQDLALSPEWTDIWSDYDLSVSPQCKQDTREAPNYRWPIPTPGGTLDKVLSKKEIRVAISEEWHDADTPSRANVAWTILHNALGRVAEWYSLPNIRVEPVFAIGDQGVFDALGDCSADTTHYALLQEDWIDGTLRESKYDSLCGANVDGDEFSGFVRRDNCKATKFINQKCRGVIEEAAKTLKYDLVRDSWAHDTQYEQNALAVYNYYVSRPRLVELSAGIFLGWENGFFMSVSPCLGLPYDSSYCPEYYSGFIATVANSRVFTPEEDYQVKVYTIDPIRQKLSLVNQHANPDSPYDVTSRPWFVNEPNQWTEPYLYAGQEGEVFGRTYVVHTVGKGYGRVSIDQVDFCPAEMSDSP